MHVLGDNPKTIINDSDNLTNQTVLKIDSPSSIKTDMAEAASFRKLQICFIGIFVSYFIYGILQEKMLELNYNLL